ncbi:hypothetical protein [Pigmentiphaga sp.]|uniref:hypothetical protein n=1 Tax=Pigmentiphaga sp. TaxID=1977564 RepID=UPI0025CDEA59|nr:hypothetical protein [Pigmentiphaga sp.]MBX6317908.1 hypothetical protein [Pigmentiphaga sp.]
MTAEEKHDYLEGQLTGLVLAIQRLVQTTPYPEATRREIARIITEEIASASDLCASDAYIAGLRATSFAVAHDR